MTVVSPHEEVAIPEISGAKVLIVATDGFAQAELMVPYKRLKEAGAAITIAAPEKTIEEKTIKGWDHKSWGDRVPVDVFVSNVATTKFDVLVLPGGIMSVDTLRIDAHVIRIVRDFVASKKIVAAVGHAPWLLIEAAVLDGRMVTSWASLRVDLENAGSMWKDTEVVVDRRIITARKSNDLEASIRLIIKEMTTRGATTTPKASI